MRRGRYWHWMKRPWQVFITPVIGVALAALALYLLLSSSPFFATSIVMLVMAIHLVFRYWIVALRFARAIRRNPQFGRAITWTFSPSGLEGQTDDSDFRLNWSGFFETCTTRDGFLFYPQKEIYYWIPRSAFSSPDDVALLESWIRGSTRNRKLG